MPTVISRNKTIAKNTIFLYIRMAFSMIVSLYTVRIVLQVLGIEDYGIYSAVGGIVSSLTIFTGALSTASQRFFSIEIGRGNNDSVNRVFNSMLLLYLLVGIIVFIIAETAGIWFLNHKMMIPKNRMDAALIILHCTLISFFVSIVTASFQAMIIAKENMKIYAYVGIYDVVIKLLIAYILHLFDTDKLILYAYLLLFASISSQLFYIIYTILRYKEVKICIKWDGQTITKITSFSSWTFVGCLAFLCNAQGLNLLMNVFFGPVVNAAYNIGNSVKNAVIQLGSNFFIAVRPSLIKEYAAENFKYVRKLFLFSTKAIFCLLFMIICPITIETKGILSLWLGEVGDYMVSFVRLMLLWALLLNLSDPITAVVQAANIVKRYHLTVDLFTLSSLPLAYLAFRFGATPNWSFIISILVLFIAHVIRLFILRNIINIGIREYFNKVVLRVLYAVCLSCIIVLIIRSVIVSNSTITLLSKIILEIFIVIGISYIIAFDADERMLINGMFKGFLKKISISK